MASSPRTLSLDLCLPCTRQPRQSGTELHEQTLSRLLKDCERNGIRLTGASLKETSILPDAFVLAADSRPDSWFRCGQYNSLCRCKTFMPMCRSAGPSACAVEMKCGTPGDEYYAGDDIEETKHREKMEWDHLPIGTRYNWSMEKGFCGERESYYQDYSFTHAKCGGAIRLLCCSECNTPLILGNDEDLQDRNPSVRGLYVHLDEIPPVKPPEDELQRLLRHALDSGNVRMACFYMSYGTLDTLDDDILFMCMMHEDTRNHMRAVEYAATRRKRVCSDGPRKVPRLC